MFFLSERIFFCQVFVNASGAIGKIPQQAERVTFYEHNTGGGIRGVTGTPKKFDEKLLVVAKATPGACAQRLLLKMVKS